LGFTLQTVPGGEQVAVMLPPGTRPGSPLWAPDGSQFAFAVSQPAEIQLWVADARTGAARQLEGVVLNAVLGGAFQWMPDSRTLLVRTVSGQGSPPVAPEAPVGPEIQESFGKPAPLRTFQDLLRSAHDEELFEYYATCQLALVDATTGQLTALGRPGLYNGVDPSPSGEFFLVDTLRKPFSRLLPAGGFPSEIAVWDREGKTVQTIASLPSAEGVPIEGVLTGPRAVQWCPTAPATLLLGRGAGWRRSPDYGAAPRSADVMDSSVPRRTHRDAAA
jgi:dipeptidyl aminopeptidase/acylaminoacyl peptidase